MDDIRDSFEKDHRRNAPLREAAARIRELEDRCARLQLEAESHAMEARTANSTIREIYQACTGATGEPGTWNGAKPVVEKITRLTAQLEEAKKRADRIKNWLGSDEHDTGENCDRPCENTSPCPCTLMFARAEVRDLLTSLNKEQDK